MIAVLIEMVLSALRELSDVEYQTRVWTGRDPGGEMSSFEECVASVFDDSNLNLALDAGSEVLGSTIDNHLQVIRDLVGRIDSARTPDEVIEDPLMQQVRNRAA